MTPVKKISENRKAFHDYFVLESFEVGVELKGTEVKSARAGAVNLRDSWVSVNDGELILNGAHISPYREGNIFNSDPKRPRKLLAHKSETIRLFGKVKRQGISIIPLSMYFKRKWVKLQIGLCKGKKLYDKRESCAKRDSERNIRRIIKEHLKTF